MGRERLAYIDALQGRQGVPQLRDSLAGWGWRGCPSKPLMLNLALSTAQRSIEKDGGEKEEQAPIPLPSLLDVLNNQG